MPIKKKEVMWEELEKFKAGAFSPSPHTHPRSEISDFWGEAFWANIPDKPSTFTPSDHASEHEIGGGDLVNHDSLTGFLANEHIDWTAANANFSTSGYAMLLTGIYSQASGSSSLKRIWAISRDTYPNHGLFYVNTPSDSIEVRWDDVKMGEILLETGYLKFPRYYMATYYLSQLAATNKVMDSDKWDGYQFADYLDQNVKQGSSPSFENITISTNITTSKLTIGSYYLNSLIANNKVPDSNRLNGLLASSYSLASHLHDDRYYTEGEVDSLLCLHDQFLELLDTPASYSGMQGKYLCVNGAENALIWCTPGGPHASSHEVDGSDLVNHDSLTGFVLNEHLNHGSISVVAGSGLSGGGTIITNRTLNLGLLTADWDAGGYLIRALRFYSDQATGVSPFIVASTTKVANLNADLWDGYEFASYINQAIKTSSKPQFAGVNLGGATYYLGSGALASKLYTLYINEIYADVGAVGDPSYTFNGDTTTGMYQGGAKNLCFATDGGLRLRLTNALATFHLPLEVPDHTVAGVDRVVNVSFGTGSPPTVTGTTKGSLFVKYTA
ncbi:hypothetical protein ES703_49073 [subsurface metagenome]